MPIKTVVESDEKKEAIKPTKQSVNAPQPATFIHYPNPGKSGKAIYKKREQPKPSPLVFLVFNLALNRKRSSASTGFAGVRIVKCKAPRIKSALPVYLHPH